ncbi:MAG: leucine-rich repeat protein [Firmicutes bacterium]|nr:leucine-rich repeat protein [Bacillota bacterium]
MKRFCKFTIIALIALLFALSITACGKDKTDAPVVTFMSDGKVHATVEAKAGASLPAPPTKEGQLFGGWFTDEGTFTQPFTTLSGVTANATVYAKWTPAGLEPSAAAEAFRTAVAGIGEVTLASGGLLANALEKYNALTEAEKVRTDVTAAWTVYLEKKAAFDDLAGQQSPAAEAFITAVSAIGDVTLSSAGLLANALEKYNALSNPEKAWADVTAALAVYNLKKAEYEALLASAGQEAAAAFVTLAGTLPAVSVLAPTKADEAKIAAVRAAYDALPEALKSAANVTGAFSTLRAAEEKFASFEGKMVLLIILRASTSMCGPNNSSTTGRTPYEAGMVGNSLLWAGAEAAKLAASALDEGDFLGLISFANSPTLRLPVSSADNTAALTTTINGITTVTGTAVGSAISLAHAEIGVVSDKCTRHILFITGGGASSTDTAIIIEEYLTAIQDMRADGISLSTVGLDTLAGTVNMVQPMAETGGGQRLSMPSTTFSANATAHFAALQADLLLARELAGVDNENSLITSVSIPEGTTEIEPFAFSGYRSLTSVIIPSSVISIGAYAFNGCRSLTNISIPASVTDLGAGAFRNCSALISVTIPSGVTIIQPHTFSGCNELTAVSVPDGVLTVGANAFSNCSSLESIDLPDSVTSLGSYAFAWCVSLTDFSFPPEVTAIPEGTFRGCTGFVSLYIPNQMTSMVRGSFQDCNGLQSITIPYVNVGTHFGVIFGSTSNLTQGEYIPPSLKEVTVLRGTVGSRAFNGCDGLTKVTLPPTITVIGEYAFNGCSSLEEVVIPEGVTNISASAFNGCTSLQSIVLPEGIANIYLEAFAGCVRLAAITMPASIAFVSTDAFLGCAGILDVFYAGSESQWNAVSGLSASFPPGATVHFNHTGG